MEKTTDAGWCLEVVNQIKQADEVIEGRKRTLVCLAQTFYLHLGLGLGSVRDEIHFFQLRKNALSE